MNYFIGMGMTSSGIILMDGDFMTVYGTETAKDTTVNSGGQLGICPEGIADVATINSGGKIEVYSGGTATNIILSSGAMFDLTVAPGTYVQCTSAGGGSIEINDAYVSSCTVDSDSFLEIESGGTADKTTVNSAGYLWVLSGGTASETTINSDGHLTVHSGGMLIDTTVNYGALMDIQSDATANRTTVESSGNCFVGGTANSATVKFGGTISIFDGTANSVTVSSGGKTEVGLDGIANNVTVDSDGHIAVSSGGTATNLILSSGAKIDWSVAPGTCVQGVSGGIAIEMNDPSVSGYTADAGCVFWVSSGGTANDVTVNSGGGIVVRSGGVANNATVNSGGSLNDPWFDSGIGLMIDSGGTANNTTVSSGGSVSIIGIANNIAVDSGGMVFILSGGKMTGLMRFENGYHLWISSGAILDFDISGLTPDAEARFIGPLSRSSKLLYTLTVSGTQANGTYRLADGAAGFNHTITVINSATGNELGTISVGGTLAVGEGSLALNLSDDGGLTLTASNMSAPDATAPTVMNVQADTTAPTDRSVVLTADFADDVELTSALFRIGETGEWIPYENGVTVSRNATVYFKAVDAAGNESEIAEYTVSNIFDATAPTVSNIRATPACPTCSPVVVTADFADNVELTSALFRIGETGDWAPYETGVTVPGNATVYFKAVDAAGNESEIAEYPVSNIMPLPNGAVVGAVIDGNAAYINSGENYVRTTVCDSLYVLSGGRAYDTTVSSGGDFWINSGGTANNTMLRSSGRLWISGGTADNAVIGSDGEFIVSSGGTASGTLIESGGYAAFYGISDSATIMSGGSLFVRSGGTATNVVASDGAELSFAVAPGTYVQGTSGGSPFEMKDAFLSDYTVARGSGGINLCSGGSADNVTITSGGTIWVSSGGTANNTTVSSGVLYVTSGGTADHTMVSSGVVDPAGHYYVSLGGNFYVYSGGTANCTVFEGHTFYVKGAANSTTLNCGSMTIETGGTANSVTVDHYGELRVSSGGTATNVMLSSESWVYFVVAPDTYIQGTLDGAAFELKDGVLPSYTVNQLCYVVVSSGGTAYDNTVNDGGTLIVSGGGTADKTTVHSSASFEVYAGGVANNTVVDSKGVFHIHSGGIMNDTIMMGADYCTFACHIVSGGTANRTIMDGWRMLIVYGEANSTVITSDAQIDVMNDGAASHTEVGKGGRLLVHDRGIAEDSIISATGVMKVSGGVAENSIIRAAGVMSVSAGGIAKDISVDPRGYLHVYSRGKITGQMDFSERAFISAYEGSVLDFNISELAPGNASALVKNLSVVQGAPVYTLTVSGSQADGVYLLADGAASFDSTITVVNMSGESLGTLAAGETVNINGDDYTLCRNSGKLKLFLNVEADETNDPVIPVISVVEEDTLLAHTMPEAEYMYGCVPTAVGMLLGYYDLYGYGSAGFSNLIEGTVKLKSRGTDGNPFNMNAFDTALGRAIASEDYVYRFYSRDGIETTPAQELEYAFKSDDKTLNTDVWNCIADYLGTGQFWRGCENLSSYPTSGSLRRLYLYDQYVEEDDEYIVSLPTCDKELTITDGSTSRTIRFTDRFLEFGLDRYVQSRGYRLDDVATGTYSVDVDGGDFTFAQYMMEIDAGRPVLICVDGGVDSGEGHAMVGYGYNESTKEIIFDNCYSSGQRMVWDGTYRYTGVDRKLQSITVFVLDESSGGPRPGEVSDVIPQMQKWEKAGDDAQYVVEYSTDNFAHVIRLTVDSNSLDSFQMPLGDYQVRVRTEGGDWTAVDPVTAEETGAEPKLVKSNEDGNADVFFVKADGVWESGYAAQHVGSIGDWGGTEETVGLTGRNMLTDMVEGSTDANILLMTDDGNGDALFVDDIYSDSPSELGLSRSRIAQLDEIRAGAGDDIVDMTSRRFEYVGDGLAIRGGDGDDTIWANKGDNFLFGDAGNDRIVGASGDDVIAGGIGNDRMHGGGGSDVFTFCDNWGTDMVEQLESGSVTLWFTSESEGKVAWDAASQSYTDGVNSVAVRGIDPASVELKFGDDGSARFDGLAAAGAFEKFTSQKIFEESGQGFLAGL